MYLAVADVYSAMRQVDLEIRDRKYPVTVRSCRGVGMPERNPDAGEQLAHAEGLGEVVVGACIQRGDLVSFREAGGQHHHRDGGPLAQPPDDLDAVDVGQPEVEDHQVRLTIRGCRQSRDPALGLVHLESVRGQPGAQEAPDLRIVLDDHYDGVAGTHETTDPRGSSAVSPASGMN